MRKKSLETRLDDLGACTPAVRWARRQRGTDAEVWKRCDRADWMAWVLIVIGPLSKDTVATRKQATLAMTACIDAAGLRLTPIQARGTRWARTWARREGDRAATNHMQGVQFALLYNERSCLSAEQDSFYSNRTVKWLVEMTGFAHYLSDGLTNLLRWIDEAQPEAAGRLKEQVCDALRRYYPRPPRVKEGN